MDQQAEFIGGINKFRNDVGNRVSDNQDNINADGTVSTTVTFVVEKDGSITQVHATGSNSSFNKEAEKAVQNVRGKWKPGKLNGVPVRSRFRFPLTMKFEF